VVSFTRKEAEAWAAMDDVGRRLWLDLRYARARLERLRSSVAKAERAVELRLREFASHRVTGVVPKRKSIVDEAKRSMDATLRHAGHHKGRGGSA
jgi:hypothetical protein